MIAVTGVGAICSIGNTAKEVFSNLIEAKPAKRFLTRPTHLKPKYPKGEPEGGEGVPWVAEVGQSNQELFEGLRRLGLTGKSKRFGRTTLLILKAIDEAAGDARLLERVLSKEIDPSRIGIFGGSTLGGTDQLEKAIREYETEGKLRTPSLLLQGSYSGLVDQVAKIFGWRGPRLMISTACSSSTVVMQYAKQMLLRGEIDVAVVFGGDPISETSLGGFSALGAMTDGNSAPFAVSPIGITLGEGAAALVFERESDGNSARPTPYAWLGGVGVASEAHHLTAPDPSGRGAREAMASAIAQAGQSPGAIQAVLAHGTGTELNDAAESKSIRQLTSPHQGDPWVLSTKGMTGHTLGGAGVINAVVACLCLKEKLFPASPNFTSPRKGVEVKISTASVPLGSEGGVLANSFGFAGSVASAAFFNHRVRLQTTTPVQKVFLTGVGCITPVLGSREELENAFLSGTRHFTIHPENRSFTGRRGTSVSGIIDLENNSKAKSILKRSRSYRRMDRLSMLAYVACSEALSQSGLRINSQNQKKIGIILGNDTGPLGVMKQFYSNLVSNGLRAGNPLLFPNTVLNACLGYVTIDHLIHGPSAFVSQGEVASGLAMAQAAALISQRSLALDSGGDPSQDMVVDSVLCGGVDELSDYQEKGYLDILQIPNAHEVDDRTEPLSPASQGFFLGEASIVLMLEGAKSALQRGAQVEAEFSGSFQSGNSGQKEREDCGAICDVLDQATHAHGVPDLLVVNASGLPSHDKAILNGISSSQTRGIPLYAPQRVFGNCRGTSGALGVLAALAAMKHQKGPSADGRSLSVAQRIKTAFVLSYGGDYAVLNVLKQPS